MGLILLNPRGIVQTGSFFGDCSPESLEHVFDQCCEPHCSPYQQSVLDCRCRRSLSHICQGHPYNCTDDHGGHQFGGFELFRVGPFSLLEIGRTAVYCTGECSDNQFQVWFHSISFSIRMDHRSVFVCFLRIILHQLFQQYFPPGFICSRVDRLSECETTFSNTSLA